MPRFGPALAWMSSWISGSGSARASAGVDVDDDELGHRQPERAPQLARDDLRDERPAPWPAPRNFVTYIPSSSASTSPGSDPPSRRAST